MRFTLLLLLPMPILTLTALAQDKKPASREAPQDIQIKILKAEVANKDAINKLTDLQNQWNQLQAQAKAIQDQAPKLQKDMQDTQATLDKQIAEGAKALGIDLTKYDFDQAKLVYNPKASPGTTSVTTPSTPPASPTTPPPNEKKQP
jgi:hypothetical protein